MIAVGVDVAEQKKGLDLVALDTDRRVLESRGRLTVEQVRTIVAEELRPEIVCVDSPSGWSRSGRSRQAERDLARLRISAYATGADPGEHPFYRWMRVGFAIFEALADRYPLFRGDDPRGRVAEVFPNASAVLLAGRRKQPHGPKLHFRRQVLLDRGVAQEQLPGIDRVDAALAALTGVMALEDQWTFVGDPDEGVILLPTRAAAPLGPSPPPTRSIASTSGMGDRTALCGCGCGAAVRRRFLPGHDAKLKSQLLVAWRSGDVAAEQRLRELGWLQDLPNI